MKKSETLQSVGFVVYPGVEELDLIGPWEIINQWREKVYGPSKVLIVGEKQEPLLCAKGLKIIPDYTFETCPSLDCLVIPGGIGTREEIKNPNSIAFIKKQGAESRYILSICTGVFLLQEAGLLDGKQVTTHWGSIDRLKKFEDLQVSQKRFINDGAIWTSAGVSSGIDMALAFVAHIAGDDVAGLVQLYCEYYPAGKIYGELEEGYTLPPYISDYDKK